MPRVDTQRTAKHFLLGTAFTLVFLLAAESPAAPRPVTVGAMRHSPSAGWSGWTLLMVQIHSIEFVLNDPDLTPPEEGGDQATAIAAALDQRDRFEGAGVLDTLAPDDLAMALLNLEALEANILANPEYLTDPRWDEYLTALGRMKFELETVLPEPGSQRRGRHESGSAP